MENKTISVDGNFTIEIKNGVHIIKIYDSYETYKEKYLLGFINQRRFDEFGGGTYYPNRYKELIFPRKLTISQNNNLISISYEKKSHYYVDYNDKETVNFFTYFIDKHKNILPRYDKTPVKEFNFSFKMIGLKLIDKSFNVPYYEEELITLNKESETVKIDTTLVSIYYIDKNATI